MDKGIKYVNPKKNPELPRGILQLDEKGKLFGIQYKDASGRRRREKAGTYKMAEDLLLKRQIESLRQTMPGSKGRYGVKISELVDDTINSVFSASSSDHAAHDLRLKLERIRSSFGDKLAHNITRQHITDWLDAETALRGWKPGSRNRYQSAWSLMFRVAVDNKKMYENPATGIKIKQEDSGRVRFLSPEEEKALGEAIKDPLQHAALILSIHSGMRLSEQARSEVGDYDPNTRMLLVRQKKNRRAPSVRYVPMTPLAADAYSLLSLDKKPGDLLCADIIDNVRWLGKCADAARLEDYSWHINRHTFASRLVMKGVPIAVVSRLLGHTNVQMTMRYAHLMPAVAEDAVAKMMSFYS